jgi:hypothetical protein
MTPTKTPAPTAAEIAAYAARVASALPGFTFDPDQETNWAARISRADGLYLLLAFETYGAKVGRVEVSARMADRDASNARIAPDLSGGESWPTFAALGPNGQEPEDCAKAIARRVLIPELEQRFTAARLKASRARDRADRFRTFCRETAARYSDRLTMTPDAQGQRAEIRIRLPGIDLQAYCTAPGDGSTHPGPIYMNGMGGTIQWDALHRMLTLLPNETFPPA